MARIGVTHNERAKNQETSHQKPRDNSPTVTRFFKVMFGKNHWNVLYLPPKFARKVQHLVGKKTSIEDSDGTRWPVTYSYSDGSLAFRKGWSEFFVAHGLKSGHFVLFNYVNESHFVVNIFDESAMEITDFNYFDSRRNKRLRPNPEIISVDDPSQPTEESLPEKPSSDDSVASRLEFRDFQTQPNVKVRPMCTIMDDPSLMIDRRDNGCYSQGEGVNILYDLSCFEMEEKKGVLNEYEKSPFFTEQDKKHPNDTEMSEVNGQPNDFDKFEEALGKKIESCRTDNTKINAPICVEKLDKVSENIVAASRSVKIEQLKMNVIHENRETFVDKASSKKTDQIILKGGAAQTSAIRSEKINSHFGNISTDKPRVKPSNNNINLRKGEQDVISGFRNGDNKLRASGIESLSVNHNKTNERRDYTVKPRYPESSVSSAVPKSPFGQRVVKKELLELRAKGKNIPEVPYDKSPINETRDGKMFLPQVKVEPDLPCTGAPSPFSTKVESQLYLRDARAHSISNRKERSEREQEGYISERPERKALSRALLVWLV
ncbi:hypothetical protein CASFOL_037866 [Castilleja foliolosa]|uniref:TF-B3 domain-containing protein n=1 Tax=Castilleja foliolosa TaxID=1961234 RepID=A0ABD3BLD3_9LAMI